VFIYIVYVYRLETCHVTKILISGSLPSFFDVLIKSVVSLMCDGSFSASSIRSSFTGADHFSMWLLTEETTGHPGSLEARKI